RTPPRRSCLDSSGPSIPTSTSAAGPRPPISPPRRPRPRQPQPQSASWRTEMARYAPGDHIEVVVEMAGRPHSIWAYAPGGKGHPENAIVVHEVAYVKR